MEPVTVAVIMGSDSDWPIMRDAVQVLKDFGVGVEADIVSAHRTPKKWWSLQKLLPRGASG